MPLLVKKIEEEEKRQVDKERQRSERNVDKTMQRIERQQNRQAEREADMKERHQARLVNKQQDSKNKGSGKGQMIDPCMRVPFDKRRHGGVLVCGVKRGDDTDSLSSKSTCLTVGK